MQQLNWKAIGSHVDVRAPCAGDWQVHLAVPCTELQDSLKHLAHQ